MTNLLDLLDDNPEEFPVSSTLKVLAAKKLAKTSSWLKAICLVETGGKQQIRLYGWQKNKEGQWKVRQKFNISKGYSAKIADIFKAFSEYEKPET
ncbi:MAG: hypothetical protein ACTSPG_03260 [Candidatus Hodarchaeales archaeon]